MMTLLCAFQFSFLYLPVLFIGMAVYGTDIKSSGGYLYIATIIVISLLLGLFKRNRYPRFLIRFNKLFLISGAIASLYLYRNLHFNYWDEHALSQAILIMLIGITSCISSINAAISGKALYTAENKIAAMLLFSIIWLVSIYYPMAAFFLIGWILLLSALFADNVERTGSFQKTDFSRYYIFMIFLDLPLVVWDFQVNSLWGAYLAASMLACGLGFLLPASHKLSRAAIVAFGINFIACAIWPEYVLHPLHNIITGLALGIYLNQQSQKHHSLSIMPAIGAAAILGLMLSILFYSNLYYANWRLIFIAPPLLYFLYQRIRVKVSNA